MSVSNHAVKRIRQRLGLNKSAATREAERAENGMCIADCGGRLRRYLDEQRHFHGKGTDFRVTPAGLFAYQYGNLATVLPWPDAHKKQVLSQWKKFSKRNVDSGESGT